MSERIRVGVAGLGKMGLSHFALVNAHPLSETIICDTTGYLIDMLGKYIPNETYKNYDKMLDEANLDAVVIATPSRLHVDMVRKALDRGLHVFCEKPFTLDWNSSAELADLAEAKGVVNQVGYHYRHVGAFQEMKRCLDAGLIGRVTQCHAQAHGPVVLRPKKSSWRTKKNEGGGCLYDYAAHPLNLANWYFGEPDWVSGTVMNKIFSNDAEDEVYATLMFPGGICTQLSVNWSDESQRKMSTKMTVFGTNGQIYADRQEIQVYLRSVPENNLGFKQGWNVRYTTELTRESWYYLRGEEYSNQMDDFITAVADGASTATSNDFRSAMITDKAIGMILADEAGQKFDEDRPHAEPARKRSWFSRA